MDRSTRIVVVLGAGAVLAYPFLTSAARADSPCSYDPASHVVTVQDPAGLPNVTLTTTLQSDGSTGFVVGVTDATGNGFGVDCGAATTENTDQIAIHGTGGGGLLLSARNAPFAPGFTPEPTGQSEIEIAADGFWQVDY